MDTHLRERLSPASLPVVLCILCGCGRTDSSDVAGPSSATSPAPSALSAAAETAPEDSVTGAAPTAATRRPDEVWEDADGRRYLGNVPYDVFFDHPLLVAADDRSVAVPDDRPAEQTTDTMSGRSDEVVDVDGVPSAPAPSTASAWASFLPAEVLEAEVKSNRNFLNQKLRSVGSYNSSVSMIPVRAATIAVLAGIAVEHPAEISWKADAGYIRDLAASMNATPLQRGAADQKRLLALFENIADILNRSRPADLPEPDPQAALSDAAEMRLLMMRMELAEQRLRTEVNESSFASDPEYVIHEAAMLSGLMWAVTTVSYGFADDPDFKGYAQKIQESGLAMRAAAGAGDFNEFQLNLSRVAGSCQACHRDYKNN